MTRQEAIDLVAGAIRSGVYNDLGSGSNVDITIITKEGVEYLRNYQYLQGRTYTMQFPPKYPRSTARAWVLCGCQRPRVSQRSLASGCSRCVMLWWWRAQRLWKRMLRIICCCAHKNSIVSPVSVSQHACRHPAGTHRAGSCVHPCASQGIDSKLLANPQAFG